MEGIDSPLNSIEKIILLMDYSSPENLIEELMQKKKNDLLLNIEIKNIIDKAFNVALK